MFFKQFPKTTYSVKNDAIQQEIADHFRYVDVIERSSQNFYSYKKEQIIDSERPDTMSKRLYGTNDYYWTFFIANDTLKNGLSAWPKGDNEINQFISNEFKNLSVYRFPFNDTRQDGVIETITGLPINNPKYLPYLYLLTPIASTPSAPGPGGDPKKVYAKVKIVDYKPNLSQIWIDSSSITWTTPESQSFENQVGDGGYVDTLWTNLAKQVFESQNSVENISMEFNIFFQSDETPEVNILREEYVKYIRDAITKFYGDKWVDDDPETVDDKSLMLLHDLYPTQYWKDSSLAPAHYYDSANPENEITEYETFDFSSPNYITYRDDMIEDNNSKKEIVVVSPSYIDQFAREYKKLLNE